MAGLVVAALAAGCSSPPTDTCADLDRDRIAELVGTEDFTTTAKGDLPTQGGGTDQQYTCTVSVDGTARLDLGAGNVEQPSTIEPERPGYFVYGEGTGRLGRDSSVLWCGTALLNIAGAQNDENALDASPGAMAATLIDLADQLRCPNG